MDFLDLIFGAAPGLVKSTANVLDAFDARRVGEFNRKAAEADAQNTEVAGRQNLRAFQRDARGFIGTQNAEIAHSGFARSGSMLDVLADNAMQLELQGRSIESSTASTAGTQRAQGRIANAQAQYAARQSFLKAGGSLLRMGKDIYDV